MDLSRVIKWIVALAIVVVAWKVVLPWAKSQKFGGSKASATGNADSSCVGSAESAANTWANGIGRFVNPPYDLNAWSSFRSDVDSKVNAAEAQCSGAEESFRKTRTALSELRGLVSELDASIRTGGAPPDGIVQRQERIDTMLNDAADLARAGK
jgi:hypothetical protein